ncbi:type IV pili twitching motility protein PilT [Candidatus Gottesmanbacteria bacterium RIFCSPLOWO2_01_FULL_48_11]|uniref:Twitching motility protein n=3 Tax=Candidatus Gottesmaniibacteriota TaxID=1752720 RepID=A0A0G1UQ18_9BACT|nr:MAG: twitching motility protein [Candidatus Gottesmanbacteria bacterium GW2011_GWA2_47_9]KKU96327.1 MAG: twitching motility protein [Candidatus Gottesmanbacteria bacterium GW2011_GWA1_48_13]OGG28104.1 MAG: type IV pili twitching motility protein PilT [Candidatus Gottesmanbacteria bacterium RIFCSPLOWO2_01_FULL_48_11]
MDIQQLFAEAARLEASDIHLLVGFAPMLRVSGALRAIGGLAALTAADTEALTFATFSPQQKDLFLTNREIDYSIASPAGRFRANVYYQKGTIGAVFRLVPAKIRSIDELGLPSICHEFVKLRQGLVLVTGPTGHGKSTTLAAMIHTINQTKPAHIITIEDPIEYVYPPGLSIVSQREMHQDTHSWTVALRSVLREDPDVVLVGEMRDFDTIQAALTVAETGHLVFATLHTNSASQTVDRIVDVFPESQQPQVRLQLSSVLEGVLSQRLIPAVAGGRVAVGEVLTGTPAVKNTIREGKTHLLDNVIQTSAELGMMTLETSLARAVKEGKISLEAATSFAVRPEELGRLLKY